jgi:hypothetical protein
LCAWEAAVVLEDLIASGRIVDAIIAFIVVEALVLSLYHRRTSLGLPPVDVVTMLLAGLFLLLALRAALTGANWIWIAAFLGAALVAHLADLRRRWWA